MAKQFFKVSNLRDKMNDKPTHPEMIGFFRGQHKGITEAHIDEMKSVITAEYTAIIKYLSGAKKAIIKAGKS